MALVLKDRVQETATPNTTVSFSCNGPVTGFQAFSVIGNGNTTYYTAVDGSGNWESGLGTYTTAGDLVTRTTISASSNAGSAVTFSGAVSLFVNYPATKSVNLDASGNVSALGTVASGTWQGSTVGVVYGGTGVTASTGANSVVLRDANENIIVNSVTQELTSTISSATITTLTAASSHFQVLTGTTTQTYKLPDATLLPTGSIWVFDNDSTGNLTVTDNAGTTIDVVAAGGYATVFLEANGTVGGEWGRFGMVPSEVNWGTNSLNLGGLTVITNGTWNGATIAYNYGGTGLTSFAAANNALYSTSASALTAGTLPVLAGGTGVTTSTGTGNNVLSTSPTLVSPALGTPTSGTLTNCTFPTLNQNTSGTAAGLSATLVATSGGTGTATTAIGDLLQGAATNTWDKLAAVATGNALISGGVTTASSWGKIGLTTHVSGTLPIANGGTNLTSYTIGDIVYASAATTLASLADVATGNAIISGGVGVAPSYGKIGLTTHVSGTLPIANGGTNSTATPTAGGAGYGTGTAHAYTAAGTSGNALISAGASAPAFGNLALGTANTNVSGALTATNGGTGVAGSLTGILYGNGTSAQSVATAAQMLTGMGVATTSTSGYLSSTNWNTFNNKQTPGPAFFVYRNTNQTGMPNNTWTKVLLNTKIFDTNTNFDVVTNNRFTPTVAGYYQVNGNVEMSGSGIIQAIAGVYKNGTLYCQGSFIYITAPDTSSAVSALVSLNGSTDYIELYAYCSGTTRIINGNVGQTTFSASMVRGL